MGCGGALGVEQAITVSFHDGTLFGRGTVQTGSLASMMGIDSRGTVRERTPQVVVTLTEVGRLVTEDDEHEVEAGRYIVNAEGMFRVIDGAAT